jgi:hypothetical protein
MVLEDAGDVVFELYGVPSTVITSRGVAVGFAMQAPMFSVNALLSRSSRLSLALYDHNPAH